MTINGDHSCGTNKIDLFLFFRLKDLQARDDAKFANEQAKNLLESHIFNMRDVLDSKEGQLLSTEGEREKIQEALSEASDWLDDEGWDSTADVSSRNCFLTVDQFKFCILLWLALLHWLNLMAKTNFHVNCSTFRSRFTVRN